MPAATSSSRILGLKLRLAPSRCANISASAPSFGPVHAAPILSFPTNGPKNRFGNILFIEKDGFHAILRAAQLQERFDVALMSTKGMSVTAARKLLDELSPHVENIFVLHDFDRSGFSICGTLGTDSRRYKFVNIPPIVDIGLRLAEAIDMNLESEPVPRLSENEWRQRAATLRGHGATPQEVEFLRDRRVELNAMTSRQLVDFIEARFAEHGVKKVIPDDDVIEEHARRIIKQRLVNKQSQEFRRSLPNKPRRSICGKICESTSTCSSKKTPNCPGMRR